MFAHVIVDIAHENVDRTFVYLIPESMKIFRGSRVRVPFGPRKVEGIVLDISKTTKISKKRIKPLLEVLDEEPTILPNLIALAEEMSEKSHSTLIEALRLMYPAALRKERVKIKTERLARLLLEQNAIDETIKEHKRSKKRQAILFLFKKEKEISLKDIRTLIKDPLPALKKLEEMQIIEIFEEEVMRSPYRGLKISLTKAPYLMRQQKEIIQEIRPLLLKGKGKFLLHGITGSGKTEVYMNLVNEVLSLNKGAIILVPEIALTPQMIRWFRNRFGERAAVLHSKLSAGEQYDEWRRIRRGIAPVVIGARSAIFAPVKNLGLVVIDEEHEQSYYSDRHPRYDAREIGESRCQREGATLLLSSATPSILSFAKARRGDYVLLEMTHRVMKRPLPEVEIIDMREELEKGNRSIFSYTLIEKMKSCLSSGQQAILFVNRRGHSSFVSCRKCGYVVKCNQCDISLTLHKGFNQDRLKCHYCGNEQKLPEKCPECGSGYIRYFGLGTQRVEEEVKKFFPEYKVLRMDADTVSKKDGHVKIIESFLKGEAQVLVGTQMIAKGHDFPKVTLVGVVAADLTLNLPDFRANERTFQLLTQVAGRAGRAEQPGQVVIQTYKPDHPCIKAASQQNYRNFFEQEFLRRRKGLYPPFTSINRMLIESKNEKEAKNLAENLYSEILKFIEKNLEFKKIVLMARWDEAPIKMLRGKHRYQVLIKTITNKKEDKLHAFLEKQARAYEKAENCNVYFELNPLNMV